ncbi:methyl-accepting chemotaxis protein [Massilia sp. MB5]|uniref:methyl-accepting chemotaxis protein n=1 Tax=unclassified Massilia TaxID=2609279 RepID=UPI00167FFDBD|nr:MULTISPECIES: methyl-accepting chemotaxis protein [unclassified Massilia]UMR30350.1 methyl-accepting chemotaxis protein [Massilia sp. MB5]
MMLNKLSIRTRLIATLAFLGLLILSLGGLGMYGMKSINLALNDVYSNQLVSSIAIGHAKNSLNRARFTLDRVVFHPDAADAGNLVKRAGEYVAEADKSWQRYLALPQSAEEKALSADLDEKRKQYINEGLLALGKALEQNNAELVDELASKKMTLLYRGFNASSEKLDEFQLKAAEENYKHSQSLYETLVSISLGAIVVGAILMVVSGITLMKAIMHPLRQLLGHFDQMAAGNLSDRIEIKRQDEMGLLLAGLAKMQQQLSGTVRSVREGSSAIAQASTEIADGNMDLSSRTEQQASSLEETASSLEELTSTVRQNADNARQANQLAVSASDVAVKGGQIVSQVVETMGAINESSKRIVDIISVIDGIAFQTNILALNAAVEAARAGEQGRGFAVVASEVRNLAQRSAAAAKEIKELISASVDNVDAGAALVDKAGSTMDEIVSSVSRVTDIMAEIMAAGEEQSSGIEQINQAVAQMDEVTQQNAALVEEAAAAAGAMQDQAAALEEVVSVFKVDGASAGNGAPARGRAAGTALALRR